MTDEDFALALQLQNQFFEEDDDRQTNRISPHKDGKPMSLVDPFWELTDPNPDMRALFLEFNEKYFWGRLAGVEVKWSSRMTLCAGLCRYEGRGGLCSISLSVPLLKLRPRKDLVETLLHEMIHAYLFVTDNNKDHDGHGPEFHKHMYRLNKETGTNITVYHNFHDEVDLYKQHWWRCNGPCQNRKPYFGYVKRSMNRAPSKNDVWWAEHQRTCGGTYTKIKEPEGYGKKKTKSEKGESNTEKETKPGKSAVKSMDIRIFGGEGKVLGKPSGAGTDQSDDKKDKLKTVPTATITSGVLSRSDSDSRFGVQDRNKKVISVSSDSKAIVDRHQSDTLPGASTPTKGVKNKPVSQGGNLPFNKVKKKTFPVIDFSDSEDDDELLAAVSEVDTNTAFIDSSANTNTAISSNTKSDIPNLGEMDNLGRKDDKSGPLSKETEDNVDPNDVRSMLRKVWGQKQIDQNKKSNITNSNNTSSQLGKKREPLDTNSGVNIANKRLKLDDNDTSSNIENRKSLHTELGNYRKVSVLNKSDKSNSEATGINSESNCKKVTSPIEKMFDKIRNKQNGGVDSSSISGKDTVIDKQTSNCDDSPTVIASDETSLCPVCNDNVPVSTINDHLDLCLTLKAIS